MGGEEFVVILPQTPRRDVLALAETAVRAVEDLNISHGASSVSDRVTISVGGATHVPEQGAPRLALLEAADQAMYKAKQSGRNQAVISSE